MKTFLLVEPNPHVNEMLITTLRRILPKKGWEIMAHHSYADASVVLESRTADISAALIAHSAKEHGKESLSLIKEIRETCPASKIVAMNQLPDGDNTCIAAGANSVLYKGEVRPATLEFAIHNLQINLM